MQSNYFINTEFAALRAGRFASLAHQTTPASVRVDAGPCLRNSCVDRVESVSS
jgi:hypothetical protein